jgi:hypothetical protein
MKVQLAGHLLLILQMMEGLGFVKGVAVCQRLNSEMVPIVNDSSPRPTIFQA